jgi:hypothetical protein
MAPRYLKASTLSDQGFAFNMPGGFGPRILACKHNYLALARVS